MLAHLGQPDKCLLNCIYCASAEVTELTYCCIQAVSKEILHLPYCLYFKCGNFRMYQTNFDNSFLFIFLSKDKALYKQNFLECTFQKKDVKTLHREFYYDSWKVCIIHFKETRGSSIRLKAFSTSESFKSFWSYCKMSWLLWSTQTMFSDRLFI